MFVDWKRCYESDPNGLPAEAVQKVIDLSLRGAKRRSNLLMQSKNDTLRLLRYARNDFLDSPYGRRGSNVLFQNTTPMEWKNIL
ncbi:MAG: hypothetical protein Q8K98_04525 [Bacteroidota bacterium]|nr:hypothetical protein [Bacteroidota bacterium]